MQASLKQLRYFVAVADCGKLSEAAKRLHVSQPALSSAVKQLEGIWERQLFVRHKAQGVSLTADGEMLLERSRQLLHDADLLRDQARELNALAAGEIHIGCFSPLAPFWVPPLLLLAQSRFPDLQLRVTEGDLAQMEHGVLQGDFELALGYGIGNAARIDSQHVCDAEPYVLLAQDHALANRDFLQLADLIDEPMILLDLPYSREYFESLFAPTGRQPNVAYRSTNFEMVRCMAAAGSGYSILNQRPQTAFCYNGRPTACVELRLPEPRPLPVVIFSYAGQQSSARAGAVADLLRSMA